MAMRREPAASGPSTVHPPRSGCPGANRDEFDGECLTGLTVCDPVLERSPDLIEDSFVRVLQSPVSVIDPVSHPGGVGASWKTQRETDHRLVAVYHAIGDERIDQEEPSSAVCDTLRICSGPAKSGGLFRLDRPASGSRLASSQPRNIELLLGQPDCLIRRAEQSPDSVDVSLGRFRIRASLDKTDRVAADRRFGPAGVEIRATVQLGEFATLDLSRDIFTQKFGPNLPGSLMHPRPAEKIGHHQFGRNVFPAGGHCGLGADS